MHASQTKLAASMPPAKIIMMPTKATAPIRGFSAGSVIEAQKATEENSPARNLLLFGMLVVYPAFVALVILMLGMAYLSPGGI
ncbi:hypothetical protein [Oryzicola mucosus]|uniref:Uncharacterized protein n=1 Tax=Oryzicola mucosus TaxID=2767425 RepID=A0A8J6PTD1_9HYPH|nr:hypothetical protein [Oryzicola mucosus]MBD0413057.1 hypothetical protein [Oryzicola mucosus]